MGHLKRAWQLRGCYDGRTTRIGYLLNMLAYTALFLAGFTGLFAYITSVEPSLMTAFAVIVFALIVIWVLAKVIHPLTIRRLRDMGFSFGAAGLISMGFFIPIAGLVVILYCVVIPSERS